MSGMRTVDDLANRFTLDAGIVRQLLEAFHARVPFNRIHNQMNLPMELIQQIWEQPWYRMLEAGKPRPTERKRRIEPSAPTPRRRARDLSLMREQVKHLQALQVGWDDICKYLGLTEEQQAAAQGISGNGVALAAQH